MPKSIPVRTGDIFDSGADIICHQVNCRGVMGAGLAYQVKRRNPGVFREYEMLCNRFGFELLGRAIILAMDNEPGRYISNCFGQISYGRGGRYTEYPALELALKSTRDFAREHDLTVAIPWGIGCGLAGGTWSVVSDIIDRVFADCSFNVEIWQISLG